MAAKLKLEDLKVRRDPDGNLMPIATQVVGLDGEIEVLPSTVGSLKGLRALDRPTNEWPVDDKIRYVREHVVNPRLCDMTPDEILDNITLWDLDMIVTAAVNAGGPQRREREAGKARARPAPRRKKSSK